MATQDRQAHDPVDHIGEFARLPWWHIAKRTWQRSADDNVGLVAAGIAFNAFFALVPFLTSVILAYALIAAPEKAAQHLAWLSQLLPEQAAGLVTDQLERVVETTGSTTGLGFVLTIGLSLWGAIRGSTGIMSALNIAYDVDDARPFLRRMGVAFGITAGLVLAFLLASVGISAVNFLSAWLPDLGGAIETILRVGYWIVSAIAVSTVVGLIYHLAPNRPDAEWRWVTAGSVIATLTWVAASIAFGFYVSNFSNYNAVYGALGAIIIFMMWLYVSAYILVAGAELNQVLDCITAHRDRSPDYCKRDEDRPPG